MIFAIKSIQNNAEFTFMEKHVFCSFQKKIPLAYWLTFVYA